MHRPAPFITFEGGEGAGKSTQINLLTDFLRSQGHVVVVTREPGGTQLAETLRNIILSPEQAHLTPPAQVLLFYAARADHLERVIRPALARGEIVLCDRFHDSTWAYQVEAGPISASFIQHLNHEIIGSTLPMLTFMLDLPVEIGLQRAQIRRGAAYIDGFEGRDIAFHHAVRRGFLKIAGEDKNRCVIVDATQPKEQIFQSIKDKTLTRFGLGAL